MGSKRGHKKTWRGARVRLPQVGPVATGTSPLANVETERPDFPIVGLGASAGGLGALEAFFEHMPIGSGAAFVVVTHQSSGHQSVLAEILGRRTQMPVVQVSEATPVEPDHVYTVRPGFKVALQNGTLHPERADADGALRMPIDYFFRSLAHDRRQRAIGIVLSGTGSDGTLGLKAIKAELGMVMAQDEQSAQYPDMPHSAIATEGVDFVLPAAEMPGELQRYLQALARGSARALLRGDSQPEVLKQVVALIQERTRHDFSNYKQSTMRRRIERRMNLHHLDDMLRYLRHLEASPTEVEQLFKELLIGVTSFFREPEAWEALVCALSRLIADKPDNYVVRAWVAGCSTGEEAYSLAIVLRECMEALQRVLSVQIFATDLDAASIEIARAGAYPAGIASDVSATRLTRFFTAEDGYYRVKKEIRDVVAFATHNMLSDPPFTKLDVITCRNVMIYLNAELQHRLLPVFHYALKEDGILLLGSSESLGPATDLFFTVDKKWKLFRRNAVTAGTHAAAEVQTGMRPTPGQPSARYTLLRNGRMAQLESAIEKMLLKELVPPTVIVNDRRDVVHIHGRTGLFLEPAQGSQAQANIFSMARSDLQVGLSSALRRAATTDEEIVVPAVPTIKTDGEALRADIRALRLREPEALRGLFRVIFEHTPQALDQVHEEPGHTAGSADGRLTELERELQYSKDSHQATIEELETANEELKSANE